MIHVRTIAVAFALSMSLLSSGSAYAQDPSAADKETARNLLLSGREKFANKDFKGAHDAFRAAYDLVKVPTTGLDLARAQEALGMLVEARDTALEVKRMPEQAKEPEIFKQARLDADALAESVGARIPSIAIKVTGLEPSMTPEVMIDGTRLPSSALEFPRKVNPGQHEVRVLATGYADQRKQVTLRENETQEIAFSMSKGAGTISEAESPKSEGHVPVWAWVSLGVGGASLVTAAILTVNASDQNDDLQRDCPSGGTFPPHHYCLSNSFKVKVDAYQMTRNTSFALWAVGAVGVSVGIIGIVVGKRSTSKPANALLVPWVSPTNAGLSLTGRF